MAFTPSQKPFFDPMQTPDGFFYMTEEFAIGGKLLSVAMNVTYEEVLQKWDDETWRSHIRHKIATVLAEKMISNNLCEINISEDVSTQNKRIIVRCYLAPNDQVKILRTLKNPNGNR